jgi:hypothetical protein
MIVILGESCDVSINRLGRKVLSNFVVERGLGFPPHTLQPSFPPLWREPLVQPTVKQNGAPARHTTALAADRGVPATRAGMTEEFGVA